MLLEQKWHRRCHAKGLSCLIHLSYEMKRQWQCAEPRASPCNLTKCCACHAKGMTVLFPHHIWNVIYNARSDRHHLATSPNTAPATQKECHDWSASHMKRHLQCAERQASPCNLTKYCACHAKGMSWLIRITYETSFTMRGATGITLQPHQILRLPRKRNVMIDPHHIWNVIYNARSDRHHLATSPNTAPATQKEFYDWSTSHMKRHLQCAERQASPCNLTKYCACHAKGVSWLIRITYETSLMRSDRHHPATSPNTAPATQKECHDWSASHMKRHLHCAERQASPCNLTKYCACHAKLHFQILEKFTENSWSCISNARPIRDRSETVPTQKTQTATRRAAKATFRTRQEQILLKITTFPAPAIIRKFTTCCACHEKWHMNFTKCCACHKKWHMNFTKCCACHEKWHMNFTKCCACHEKWHMNFTKCCTCHKKGDINLTKVAPATKSETWTAPNAAPATKLLLLLLLGLLLLGLLLLGLLLLGLLLLGLLLLGLLLLGLLLLALLLLGLSPTTRTTTTRTTTTRTTTTRTTTTRTTTTGTTTTRTTTTRTTTTRTTTTGTTTTRTTTTRTTTATTTTARTTIPVRLPKSSYIGSLPLNFLWPEGARRVDKLTNHSLLAAPTSHVSCKFTAFASWS